MKFWGRVFGPLQVLKKKPGMAEASIFFRSGKIGQPDKKGAFRTVISKTIFGTCRAKKHPVRNIDLLYATGREQQFSQKRSRLELRLKKWQSAVNFFKRWEVGGFFSSKAGPFVLSDKKKTIQN